MAILWRVLFVVLTVRLLLPPGMCVCKLQAPAAQVLHWMFGEEAPRPVPADHHDDHHPGCPASFLSLGLGLTPLPVPSLDLLAADLPGVSLSFATPPLPTTEPPTPASDPLCADPPLFVSHCALTV